MKRLLPVFVGSLVVVGVALAQENKGGELTDPVEILKKVDAAAKAVKVARYKCTFERIGGGPAQVPKVEGTALIEGWSGGGPKNFLIDATVQQPGSEDKTRITAGGDGNEYFVIDHANKKAYVDIDQAVMGRTGRPATLILFAEFVHETPFSDEINGQKQELRGSKNIEGEDCYEIYVKYSGGQEAIWHFSKKDLLPRARLDIFKSPDGAEVKQQKTVSKLEVDPKLDASAFKFKLPDGYEKIEDFAP